MFNILSDCHKSDEIYYLLNAFRLDKKLDPIQKRAPARSVQLEAVYLEALLYLENLRQHKFVLRLTDLYHVLVAT